MNRTGDLFRKNLAWRGLIPCAAATAFLALACSSAVDSGGEEPTQSTSEALSTPYDWPQFFGNSQHTGNNTLETQLTAQNVSGLAQLFRISLPAVADSAPVILTGINAGGSVRDLAFVTTQAGHVFALDAKTGATIWSTVNTGSNFTTSSPALDPNRAFVYAYGLDGKIHKYAVATGVETTSGGWPAIATIKPQFEKGITSLSLVSTGTNNYLSVGFSGYGDFNDYQGHVTTVNLATGGQTVFNANCSNQAVHFTTGGSPDCATTMSAIWGRSGVVYSAATGRIYAGTGNGTFDPTNHLWGDTVIALNPDGTGANGNPLDTYTPSVFQTLQDQDLDLGSASPAILPNSGSKYPHLALQAGKDNQLRLLNLDNLSGQGAPGHVGGEVYALTLPQLGSVTASMPVWTNPADNSTWVFVISTGTSGGITAFKLLLDAAGNPSLGAMWQQPTTAGTALIANNVLYRASNNRIAALNPSTGATLWSDTSIGLVHWHSPVVANGVLYITDKSAQLVAYSLSATPLTALSRTGWIASSSASDGADVGAHALDGDPNTRFTTGQPQSGAATQSFTVDMLSARNFSQITLDSGGGDYARNYQVFASNDPNNWGTAIASGSSASALTTIGFSQQSARYLQVRQLTATGVGSWWSMNEFNVYGPGGTVNPSTPLPRTGWTASATASNGGDVPVNALDGSAATRWSSGFAQSAGAASYTLDMQSAKVFDHLTLDSGSDYARSFQVFVSNDPNNWGTAVASGTGTTATTTVNFAQQNARYIQIRQAVSAGTGSWWSIYELNVFTPGSSTSLTALSRAGWVATGSYTAEAPGLSIDGDPNTRWSSGAAQSNGQYLQVDMLSAKTFKQLTIDAGTSVNDYPRGYQVFVSNDGASWGSAVASGAGSTASSVTTVTFSQQTARFIKVVQTGTANPYWWSVYEFNVYN